MKPITIVDMLFIWGILLLGSFQNFLIASDCGQIAFNKKKKSSSGEFRPLLWLPSNSSLGLSWCWAAVRERERERGIRAISVTRGLALLPPSNMSYEFKAFFRSPKPLPSWWMENAFCSIPVFRDERLSRLRGASASSFMLPMSEASIKGFLIFNSYCRHHPPGFLGLTSTQYPFDYF